MVITLPFRFSPSMEIIPSRTKTDSILSTASRLVGLPPDLAYFKKRIHFDEELAREIESEVKSFLADLESEILKITECAA